MGLVIASVDFIDIKYLLKCIFTVALNEEDECDLENPPNPYEEAKLYLKNRIASNTILTENNIYLNDEHSVGNEDTDIESIVSIKISSDKNNVYQIIWDIYENCLTESNSSKIYENHDNMQYSPTVAKKLLEFCKLISCWSAVMVPIFKYGEITETSASSESLFNELKNHTFKHKTLPISIDEFVQEHIDNISGSMKNLGSKQKIDSSPKQKCMKFENDVLDEQLHNLENTYFKNSIKNINEENKITSPSVISPANRNNYSSSDDENIKILNTLQKFNSSPEKKNMKIEN